MLALDEGRDEFRAAAGAVINQYTRVDMTEVRIVLELRPVRGACATVVAAQIEG